ncbi:hypothetical protein CHRYSEOSP005_31140 [Chryseobacterium sp. Alg-005]|uniref:hypothetical protein n=1 Tax=Chryseobacterium sp. Alg-005 TaxID=3159516 RepID=UPI003555883F
MKITFYLQADTGQNLYCLINDGKDETAFSMNYVIDPQLWDSEKGEVNDNNPYFFVLQDFKNYLSRRYFELKAVETVAVLNILKEETLDLLKKSGIDGISKKVFNIMSAEIGLPEYDGYLLAFEKYTGLKRENYKVEILDYHLRFHTDDEVYEIDTYEGTTTLLKNIINHRSYLDIITLTEEDNWSEIYDEYIPKEKFISVMLDELEYCLRDNFKSTGLYIKNENIKKFKEEIRRQFEVFKNRYEHSNVIDLALEINEDILYPKAVITMTRIFDLDTCCTEYCDLEFATGDWKAIFMDDELEEEDDNLPVFYIRPYV